MANALYQLSYSPPTMPRPIIGTEQELSRFLPGSANFKVGQIHIKSL